MKWLAGAKSRLERVVGTIKKDEKELRKAQRRYLARRKEAYKANEQKKARMIRADVLREEGCTKAARKVDREAGVFKHKAVTAHTKAEYWLGQTKEWTQRIHKLETNREIIRKNITEWEHKHGVVVEGNKARGGTPRQRLQALLEAAEYNCAHGKQNNFYSQGGSWDVHHCVGGDSAGDRMGYEHRFDCSSFATGIHWGAGLSDPNGYNYTAGFTGTLMGHCEKISRSEVKVGDFVIYGAYPGHHVEVVLDPVREITIGHGSAPIDKGVFNLFGDGNYAFYRNPALA